MFFHPFTFNLSVSLTLKWASYRQHITGSHFLSILPIFAFTWRIDPYVYVYTMDTFSSVAQLCPTLCNPMNHSMPGLLVHHQLPESTQIHVHWVGNAIQPSHFLSSPLLLRPSFFPSIRDFSNGSALHIRWAKYWSFNFNISPSKEYPGLTCLRMDWLDLLAVQRTLKSLLQHHN